MQTKNEEPEQNFAPIKCRILQIIELKEVKREKFFNEIGVAKSNFSKSACKSEVSASVCSKILNYFTDVSAEWLLTGEGEMLKNQQKSNETETEREWRDLYYEQKSLLEEQRKIIDNMNSENKKHSAQEEEDAGCAGVDTTVTA